MKDYDTISKMCESGAHTAVVIFMDAHHLLFYLEAQNLVKTIALGRTPKMFYHPVENSVKILKNDRRAKKFRGLEDERKKNSITLYQFEKVKVNVFRSKETPFGYHLEVDI